MNLEYVVETSYSDGTYWSFYALTLSLVDARHICDMLTKTSQGNFKARIVKKEIVE